MRISVVLPTARLGGMDVLFSCLNLQIFSRDDWELVLIDHWYDLRAPIIMKAAQAFGINVQHVPAPASTIYNNSSCWNAGLRCCRGELICFMVDFMWVPPDYLADHWRFYEQNGFTMTGYLDRYAPPQLKSECTIKELAWSVFDQEFNAERAAAYFANNQPEYRERKGGMVGPLHPSGYHTMPWHLVYMIPDSVPLEILKQVNGWDQRFNGMYGSNDINLAYRCELFGHKFLLNPVSISQKLGTPKSSALLPAKLSAFEKTGTPEDAYALHLKIKERIDTGQETYAVPDRFGAWR